jgi:hypothetical protein
MRAPGGDDGAFPSYAPRSIVPLPVRDVGGWRLKVTQVLAPGRTAESALVDASAAAAERFLPTPALTPLHYGVGILIVHQGTRYDFVLVGYWTHETELRYETYMRASSDSTRLEALAGGDLATDVWDLRVLAFERDAWLEHVLRAPERPGDRDRPWEDRLAAYLGARLEATL